jgi:hypothetical protein
LAAIASHRSGYDRRVLAGLALAALAAGIWAVWFAAPPVDVITAGPAVRIDTRFLGEHFVASTVIEVVANDGSPVFRATSPASKCRSELFVFAAGANDVPHVATRDCTIEVPHDAPTFTLQAGASYTFTVDAKNWFGRIRTASRRFTVPGASGGA